MALLDATELPDGLFYPALFLRFVERGLPSANLEPWWIFDATHARKLMKGLPSRYPEAVLLPFARREDNDDIACFELGSPGKVLILHDFSSTAWVRREVLDGVDAWLRRAVEDMIEFDELEPPARAP